MPGIDINIETIKASIDAEIEKSGSSQELEELRYKNIWAEKACWRS